MIKIENYNCKYLKLNSSYIDDYINSLLTVTPKYSKIDLEYSINCSDTIYQDTITNVNFNNFVIDISKLKDKDNTIKNITLKNIASNTEFKTSDINIKANLITGLDIVYNILPLLTSLSLDTSALDASITGNLITIWGVPSGLIPYKLSITENTEEFLFKFNNRDSYILSLDTLYILPASFNSINLIDGVYKIKIKYTLLDGSTIEESQCFFADCTIKCKIAALLEKALEDNTLNKDLYLSYLALSNSNNCGGCNCDDMCLLYENMINYLENPFVKEKINSKECCNGCN